MLFFVFVAMLSVLVNVDTLAALGDLAERYQDARGMLQLGKAAVARGLPIEYYAFPTVGVPRYSAIGPGIDTAMLFAIMPLRNFLPGSPPPGSWIDQALVLWVLIGLVVAMTIFIFAWWRSRDRKQPAKD